MQWNFKMLTKTKPPNRILFLFSIAPDSKEWSNFPAAIHLFMTYTIHLQISGIWEQCNSSEHLLTFTFNSHVHMSAALAELFSFWLKRRKGEGKQSGKDARILILLIKFFVQTSYWMSLISDVNTLRSDHQFSSYEQ